MPGPRIPASFSAARAGLRTAPPGAPYGEAVAAAWDRALVERGPGGDGGPLDGVLAQDVRAILISEGGVAFVGRLAALLSADHDALRALLGRLVDAGRIEFVGGRRSVVRLCEWDEALSLRPGAVQERCARCGREAPIRARGLCGRCHEGTLVTPSRPRSDCHCGNRAVARGLCASCSRRRRHGAPACPECGLPMRRRRYMGQPAGCPRRCDAGARKAG